MRSFRLSIALACLLTPTAVMAIAVPETVGAATLDGIATIASPGTSNYLASGGSEDEYTVSLPAQAACSGDTATDGYHVFSYLVEPGTSITGITFPDNLPNTGDNQYGFVNNAGGYYGDANTAPTTGQIIEIPNNLEFGPLVSGGLVTLDTLLYQDGNTSGQWEGGLACTNTDGVVTDYWNTAITFTASGTDPNGFVWSSIPGPPGSQVSNITSMDTATFTEGTNGSFTPTATGTPTPTITEQGTLPNGVSFSGGALHGTPTQSGTFPITFTATNGIGNPDVQDFTLTVNPQGSKSPPSITSSTSDAFAQGVADSFTVTTTGTPTPGITEAGALPSGITFANNGNGTATLSGDATVSGTYTVTITASNGDSPNATQSFTLTVNPPTTTWTQLSPQTTPGNLGEASMAYDPATSQVILFGGQNSSNNFVNGTWSWNGTTWAELSPTTSPSPRCNASMAYDAATGQLLLFGGMGSGTTYLNDTWDWNGSNWTQLSPATSPPVRQNASMAYDSATSQIILFGGVGNSTSTGSDTWSWNGSTWTELSPATSPSSRSRAPLTYDPATSQLILFGGFSNSNSALLGDTWTWTGTDWDQLSPTTSPSARSWEALTFDPTTEQLVLFGGATTKNDALGDTWNWDGTTWEQLAPANSPSKRNRVVTAYDPATSQLILYGGWADKAFLGDTWNYSAVPAVAPTAPTIGTATGGNGQATITFNPPSNNGGAAISSYTVTAQDLTTSANGGETASSSGSPLTVTGLTNGDTYDFTVTATNSVGLTGPASETSNSVVPATVPGAPVIGTAIAGAGQATVSFSPPTSDGGSEVMSYTVTATDETTPANGGETQSGTTSPIIVNGLTNGDTYSFTVTATNGVGTGPASVASNSVVIGGGVTSITPSQIVRPSATDVVIDGTGFTSPIGVTISGGGVTPTLVGTTSTAVTIKAKVSSNAALGARTVTVTTGSGSFVCSNCLTLIASMTFTGMNPSSASQNSSTDVTLTGSGFAPGATIKGPKGTRFTDVSVVGSTMITAVLSVSSSAKTGTDLPVTVSNSASEGKKKVTSGLLTVTPATGGGLELSGRKDTTFPTFRWGSAASQRCCLYHNVRVSNTSSSPITVSIDGTLEEFFVDSNGSCANDINWNAYPYVLTMAAHRSCRLQIAFNIEEAGPGQWSGYQDFKDQDGTSELDFYLTILPPKS